MSRLILYILCNQNFLTWCKEYGNDSTTAPIKTAQFYSGQSRSLLTILYCEIWSQSTYCVQKYLQRHFYVAEHNDMTVMLPFDRRCLGIFINVRLRKRPFSRITEQPENIKLLIQASTWHAGLKMLLYLGGSFCCYCFFFLLKVVQ